MIEILTTDFIKFVETPDARRTFDEYEARKKHLGSLFSEESIDSVKEEDFAEVFRNLLTIDAYRGYLAAVDKYSYESIREHFKYFLYGTDPLEMRFDSFFEHIPEINQLAVMEIATFAQPKNFCIWDEAAKKTIIYIGHN
ncbi:MAG: hypothetical protein NZ570_01200, partial [Candidatus Caldarchaeum sp.]|nr:hypothetical protein [Candidatus Caldarchaeum sp.]MDW8360091.1 hypothetical protein [Candidatus Caldarchaeum sp.]